MAKRCPACRQPVSPSAVICVNCGYDRRTRGRIIRKEGASEPTPPRPWEWLLSPMTAALVAILAWGLFFFAAKGDPALTKAYIASVTIIGATLFVVQVVRIIASGLDFHDYLMLWYWPEYFMMSDDYEGYVQSLLMATIVAGIGIPILHLSLTHP